MEARPPAQPDEEAAADEGSGAALRDAQTLANNTVAALGSPGALRVGDPISAPAMKWQYVGFPHTACMDGSATGLGINVNPDSDRLVIYVDQVVSAALNDVTALLTPRSWGPRDLNKRPTGILDRADSSNPFRQWNLVYIPMCTGDMNTGATPHGYGGSPQVGVLNFKEYLARLAPTFKHVQRVVLAGSSSGGFGALWNWLDTQEAFSDVPVDLLSDSAPPFGPDVLPACAQRRLAEQLNWRASVHEACTDCDVRDGQVVEPYLQTILARATSSRVAFLSYDEDATFKTFFGYVLDDCKHLDDLIPPTFPEGKYPKALQQLVSDLSGHQNVAFYIAHGSEHTFLDTSFNVRSRGVELSDWLSAFIEGGPGFKTVVP